MKYSNSKTIVPILWKCAAEEALTAEEQEFFTSWLAASEHNREVLRRISDRKAFGSNVKLLLERDSRPTWEKILRNIEAGKKDPLVVVPMRSSRGKYFKYAAAILIFIMGSLWFFLDRKSQKETVKVDTFQGPVRDVLSDKSEGYLNLPDGSVIDLSENKNNGVVLSYNGYRLINNIKEGVIVIDAAGSHFPADQLPITNITLSTPRGARGRFYKVVFADKSTVALNAASSLRFPISFSSKKRKVELTGEAYYVVASVNSFSNHSSDHPSNHSSDHFNSIAANNRVPFEVEANGVDVKVLGTHFNVKAYPEDGKVTTTLEEGSVEMAKNGQVCLLEPGQKAEVADGEKAIRVSKANLGTLTWKAGRFIYTGQPAEYVLNQVSRWYNIPVDFRYHTAKNAPYTYTGTIFNTMKLVDVVRMLRSGGMNVSQQNNKLVLGAPFKS